MTAATAPAATAVARRLQFRSTHPVSACAAALTASAPWDDAGQFQAQSVPHSLRQRNRYIPLVTDDHPGGVPAATPLVGRRLRVNPLQTLKEACERACLPSDLWLFRMWDERLDSVGPTVLALVSALAVHPYFWLGSLDAGRLFWGAVLGPLPLLGEALVCAIGCVAAAWHLRTWWNSTLVLLRPIAAVAEAAAPAAAAPADDLQQFDLDAPTAPMWVYATALLRLVALHGAAVALLAPTLTVHASLAIAAAAYVASLVAALVSTPLRDSILAAPMAVVMSPLLVSELAFLSLLAVNAHFITLGASFAVFASTLGALSLALAVSLWRLVSDEEYQERLLHFFAQEGDAVSFHVTIRLPGPKGAVIDSTKGRSPLRIALSAPVVEALAQRREGGSNSEAPGMAEGDSDASGRPGGDGDSGSSDMSAAVATVSHVVASEGDTSGTAAASSQAIASASADSAATATQAAAQTAPAAAQESTSWTSGAPDAAVDGDEPGDSAGNDEDGLVLEYEEEEGEPVALAFRQRPPATSSKEDLSRQFGGRFKVLEPTLNAALQGATLGQTLELTTVNQKHNGFRNPDLHWWQPRDSFEAKFKHAPNEPSVGDVFIYPMDDPCGDADEPQLIPVRIVALADRFVELDGNAGIAGRPFLVQIEVVQVDRPRQLANATF